MYVFSFRDLSDQIKKVTKDSHVRAENTKMMLSFQRGQVTLPQYKVKKLRTVRQIICHFWIIRFLFDTVLSPLQLLLCSLYEIYQALEEALDRNSNHPAVAPIYFPAELARLKSIEKDLEFFYGQDWREKIVVPAATERYCHRLRQVCFTGQCIKAPLLVYYLSIIHQILSKYFLFLNL